MNEYEKAFHNVDVRFWKETKVAKKEHRVTDKMIGKAEILLEIKDEAIRLLEKELKK